IGEPVNFFQRSATERWRAIAPATDSLHFEKLILPKSGWWERALKSVFTPVMAVKGVVRRVLMKAGISRGLVIRMLWPPYFMKAREFTVREKIWYMGSAVMTVSS